MSKRKSAPSKFYVGRHARLKPVSDGTRLGVKQELEADTVVCKMPGEGEVEITPIEDGIQVRLLHDAAHTAVIEPCIGNVFRLRIIPDPIPRGRRWKK
jgi:hypothetical protein